MSPGVSLRMRGGFFFLSRMSSDVWYPADVEAMTGRFHKRAVEPIGPRSGDRFDKFKRTWEFVKTMGIELRYDELDLHADELLDGCCVDQNGAAALLIYTDLVLTFRESLIPVRHCLRLPTSWVRPCRTASP